MPRFEVPGGAVHLTWRLHRTQPSLTERERDIVCEVIAASKRFGCQVLAGVVMDDHVHVLFRPGADRSSMAFAGSWKSISANIICGTGPRRSPLWQRDSYQRWMRSPAQTTTCAAYIRDNPRRRWPGIKCYPWLLP